MFRWIVIGVMFTLGTGCESLGGLVGIESSASGEPAQETSGGASSPSAEGRAEGRPSQDTEEAAEPTDEQIAAAMVALLTGELHSASFETDPPALESRLSTAQLHTLKRRAEDVVRAWFRETGYSGAADPMGQELTFRVCLLERMRLDGETDEGASRRVCGQRRSYNLHTDFSEIHRSLPARIFYFERAVERLPEAAQAAARLRFAQRLGWEPVWFNAGTTTFALKPVAAEEWTPGQIRLAQTFATAAGEIEGASEVQAMLADALGRADTHECRWSPAALVRESRGGGFGPPAYDPNLTVRPDIAGSGGVVPCEEARQVRSEPAALRAVRRSHDEPRSVLAVEAVDGQPWQTNHNGLGQPTSMTRVVRLYRRVER